MRESREPTVEPTLGQAFELGDLCVDPVAGEMRGPEGREKLDPKVMSVLVLLAQRAGKVVSREELLDKIWPGMVVTDHVLSRCVYQLRGHLRRAGAAGRDKVLLETLPKRGYRLNGEVSLPQQPGLAPSTTEAHVAAPSRLKWLIGAVGGLVVAAAAVVGFLQESDYFWRNPLANASFVYLTDFEGVEQHAAISRNGNFVAFLSDHEGSMEAFVSQIGAGGFSNLTLGRAPELANPGTRNIGFSPDGSLVFLWVRATDPSEDGPATVQVWAVPTLGGPLRPYFEDVSELDWSVDGTRMVYHPAVPGDPLFVTEADKKADRQIFIAAPGVHNHFPLWSPDGAFIYFVHGLPPDAMDVWRIRPTGGDPERMTFHSSAVAYPVLLDAQTLLYLATDEDGSGPWLYGMDVERGIAHRISFGVQRYTSIAASQERRRLVATVADEKASLWRVPILDRMIEESDASRIALSTGSGRSPRVGPNYLLYVAANGTDSVWKFTSGAATEIWSGQRGRVVAAPSVSPHGDRIAFPVSRGERNTLYLMNVDGTGARPLAEELDVRGAPAWSPDGEWIAIAADQGRGAQLFRIPVDGGSAIAMVEEYSIEPVWSPDGEFLVYGGAEVGPAFPLKAVTLDGKPHTVPSVILPRGARRVSFLAGRPILVVLQGEVRHKNFWLVDLETETSRQLTNFGPEFVIGDFDVSPDGREIVFDRVREESDVVMIELPRR